MRNIVARSTFQLLFSPDLTQMSESERVSDD